MRKATVGVSRVLTAPGFLQTATAVVIDGW